MLPGSVAVGDIQPSRPPGGDPGCRRYPGAVARREQIGSWIEGTPDPSGAGRGLGLPTAGRGSRAPLGRRAVALVVDWAVASLISAAFFGYEALATLAVFGLSTALLVGTAGFTIGHRVLGLQVVRFVELVTPADASARRGSGGAAASTDAGGATGVWGPPGLLLAIVRTALLCLVVPAVVWDGNGRGLHDVAAGTVIVRR